MRMWPLLETSLEGQDPAHRVLAGSDQAPRAEHGKRPTTAGRSTSSPEDNRGDAMSGHEGDSWNAGSPKGVMTVAELAGRPGASRAPGPPGLDDKGEQGRRAAPNATGIVLRPYEGRRD